MDEIERISIELGKINFLLDSLYALVLRDMGATAADIGPLADEMRRQATELPATVYGQQPSPERLRQHTELLAARLDQFFVGVRKRLETDQAR